MEQMYFISGVSVLTGEREKISRLMPIDIAQSLYNRELELSRYKRYKAYLDLRLEKVLPKESKIVFNEAD